jgi:hypothetical protein
MRTELIDLIKETVKRFDISYDTYYHTILLFNVIKLKCNSNNTDNKQEYFKIPVRNNHPYNQFDNEYSAVNNNFN